MNSMKTDTNTPPPVALRWMASDLRDLFRLSTSDAAVNVKNGPLFISENIGMHFDLPQPDSPTISVNFNMTD